MTYLTGTKRNFYIIGAVIALLAIVLSIIFFHVMYGATTAKASSKSSGRSAQQVIVSSVANLSPNNAPLSVNGQITSQNEATILSQTSGEIVSLDKQLGYQVSAGETIATIENSSQQAAVLQAQGSYDAAEATLAEVSGTNALNSNVNSAQANQNVQNEQT